MKFHLLQGENVYKTDYGLSNIYEKCSRREPGYALLKYNAFTIIKNFSRKEPGYALLR